jgi:acetyl-CoA C-acetyltransferase
MTTGSPPTAPPRRVALVGANRIPFGKVGGAYAGVGNLEMLTAALDGLVARFGLQGERLDEVSAGAVLKHSRDFNLARDAVLGSALSAHTPAYDVQRACATGLEAIWGVADKIALGQADVGVGGGVDSASDAPVVVSDRLRDVVMRASRARSTGQRLHALTSLRPRDLVPVAPGTAERRTGLSMGEHQALTNLRWGITREAQDQLALESHRRLAAAYDSGLFDDLVTPFHGLTRDQTLRTDTSLERLAALPTVFGRGPDATLTAGNSTPLTDGASVVLLASDEWAAARGLPILAHLVDVEVAAVDYVTGDEGLLMGGAYAVPRLLARRGLTLADVDLVEIHEAFAGTVLTTLAAWADEDFCRRQVGMAGALGEVDRSRLNVAGSSLATGHPFAATGARIVATLAALLARDGGRRGLLSVCAAGGQAVAMLLERP